VYRPMPPGDRYRSCSALTATRTKRILSVQPVCDGGGSEHALIRMIRQLTEDGWECHVAVPTPAGLADEYAAAGAVLHIVSMARLTASGSAVRWIGYVARWPLSVWRVTRLVRRTGATVVHTNSLHSWYGWAAALLARRPHVWHAREIVFQSPAALRVERALTRRFADAVVAVSAAVATQLDPANLTVITDEADPALFRPDQAGRFRRGAGIAEGVPLVGSVGRLDTWKGFGVLLDAYPAIRQGCPGVELVVAGGPVAGKEEYAAGLQARAAGLAGVHWLGPRRDVAELMADLDVFVQVSTEPEPFGLVVVEALAAGVPVVAGAAGGPLEILGSAAAGGGGDPAGRLVEPGDPEALAEAVLSLLPRAASSAAARRARRPLRRPDPGQFSVLFDRVATAGRHGRWRAEPAASR
jgi:glycosyltransferase involved in cell wall biosynthesis